MSRKKNLVFDSSVELTGEKDPNSAREASDRQLKQEMVLSYIHQFQKIEQRIAKAKTYILDSHSKRSNSHGGGETNHKMKELLAEQRILSQKLRESNVDKLQDRERYLDSMMKSLNTQNDNLKEQMANIDFETPFLEQKQEVTQTNLELSSELKEVKSELKLLLRDNRELAKEGKANHFNYDTIARVYQKLINEHNLEDKIPQFNPSVDESAIKISDDYLEQKLRQIKQAQKMLDKRTMIANEMEGLVKITQELLMKKDKELDEDYLNIRLINRLSNHYHSRSIISRHRLTSSMDQNSFSQHRKMSPLNFREKNSKLNPHSSKNIFITSKGIHRWGKKNQASKLPRIQSSDKLIHKNKGSKHSKREKFKHRRINSNPVGGLHSLMNTSLSNSHSKFGIKTNNFDIDSPNNNKKNKFAKPPTSKKNSMVKLPSMRNSINSLNSDGSHPNFRSQKKIKQTQNLPLRAEKKKLSTILSKATENDLSRREIEGYELETEENKPDSSIKYYKNKEDKMMKPSDIEEVLKTQPTPRHNFRVDLGKKEEFSGKLIQNQQKQKPKQKKQVFNFSNGSQVKSASKNMNILSDKQSPTITVSEVPFKKPGKYYYRKESSQSCNSFGKPSKTQDHQNEEDKVDSVDSIGSRDSTQQISPIKIKLGLSTPKPLFNPNEIMSDSEISHQKQEESQQPKVSKFNQLKDIEGVRKKKPKLSFPMKISESDKSEKSGKEIEDKQITILKTSKLKSILSPSRTRGGSNFSSVNKSNKTKSVKFFDKAPDVIQSDYNDSSNLDELESSFDMNNKPTPPFVQRASKFKPTGKIKLNDYQEFLRKKEAQEKGGKHFNPNELDSSQDNQSERFLSQNDTIIGQGRRGRRPTRIPSINEMVDSESESMKSRGHSNPDKIPETQSDKKSNLRKRLRIKSDKPIESPRLINRKDKSVTLNDPDNRGITNLNKFKGRTSKRDKKSVIFTNVSSEKQDIYAPQEMVVRNVSSSEDEEIPKLDTEDEEKYQVTLTSEIELDSYDRQSTYNSSYEMSQGRNLSGLRREVIEIGNINKSMLSNYQIYDDYKFLNNYHLKKIYTINFQEYKEGISFLQFEYLTEKGEIVKGLPMGHKNDDLKLNVYKMEGDDRFMTIYTGFMFNHIMFLKLTTLENSAVCSMGLDQYNQNLSHLDITLQASETLSAAKCAFKSEFFVFLKVRQGLI